MAPAASEPPNPTCSQCGPSELRVYWKTFTNGSQHIKGVCSRCDRHVGWLPRTPAFRALADARSEDDAVAALFLLESALGFRMGLDRNGCVMIVPPKVGWLVFDLVSEAGDRLVEELKRRATQEGDR